MLQITGNNDLSTQPNKKKINQDAPKGDGRARGDGGTDRSMKIC